MQKFGDILGINEGDIYNDRMQIKKSSHDINLNHIQYHRKLYDLIQKEKK